MRALAPFDGAAFHSCWAIAAVKPVVQATGIANGVACAVTAPKWRDCATAIKACNCHVVVVLDCSRGQVGLFRGLIEHSVVVGRTALTRGGATGTITRAVTFA